MGGSETPPDPPQAGAARPPRADPSDQVLAVVKDLFFVARIRETGRLAGVPLAFAVSAEEAQAALTAAPRFLLLDLTASLDYERIFAAAETARVPVLAFTTHVLAPRTRPWHGRCARVVTKETLTAELPSLLREGVTA